MFADYQSLVMRYYEESRVANKLSPNLVDTTAAKLKAEFVLVIEERYLTDDLPMLRRIFGSRDNADAYRSLVKTKPADKFKPLNNFLNKRTQDTEERNIELLAWLIDFKPRPYRIGHDYSSLEQGQKISPKETDSQKAEVTATPVQTLIRPVVQPVLHKGPFKNRGVLVTALIAVIAIGIYFISTRHSAPITGCMYWDKDHYVEADCNVPKQDTALVKLDKQKLQTFKRLTKVDTVSRASIGKLWYVRINGKMELFTGEGMHPLYQGKELKPLNDYAINVCVKQHD